MSKDIVICAPVRTAIGSFGGSLKSTSAAMLGAHAIAATLRRARLDPERVDAVVIGNVVQAGNGMNIARQAAIHGGLPVNLREVLLDSRSHILLRHAIWEL